MTANVPIFTQTTYECGSLAKYGPGSYTGTFYEGPFTNNLCTSGSVVNSDVNDALSVTSLACEACPESGGVIVHYWAMQFSFFMVNAGNYYGFSAYYPIRLNIKPTSCSPLVFPTYTGTVVCYGSEREDPCNPLSRLDISTVFQNTVGKTVTIDISE